MNMLDCDGRKLIRDRKALERALRAHLLRHWAIVMGRARLRLVK